LVAGLIVVVVLGAAVVTSLLPAEAQRAIFHAPILIVVLVVGTAWVLWRISRPRPSA
jgi:FtsH-binding integral membrane protein